MSFLNRIFLAGVLLCAANVINAQDSAAIWAEKNSAALETITEVSLTETLQQGAPALQALLGAVKTDGASDPVELTRIAAMSQHVMRKGAPSRHRKAYATALLQAAESATDADVICFFLDQLRWCGVPRQAVAIRKLENSEAPGVAELAAITAQSVSDKWSERVADVPMTRYAQLNRDLAALKPKALMPALLEAFADPDAAYAGIALTWARSAGDQSDTYTWASKLQSATGTHKIMLLDMLGARGDKVAMPELNACISDEDDTVANTAQRAMVQLDSVAFAVAMPIYLKDLPPNRQIMTRDNLRFVKTEDLFAPLTANYASFSDPGKYIVLELLRERNVKSGLPIGLAAIEATDNKTAMLGFRLLRDIATPAEAATLAKHLHSRASKRRLDAQNAFAAAARRDTSGVYTSTLFDALAVASDAEKPVLLETTARIGGDQLLSLVQNATAATDADVATAAMRALADWVDNASLPLLLRHAITAPDVRRQTLAFRGASKRLEAEGFDKKPYHQEWQKIRDLPGNEAHKKALEELMVIAITE